jgi:hypothetical protein
LIKNLKLLITDKLPVPQPLKYRELDVRWPRTREAHSFEWAYFIFVTGQKKSALRNFSENAPLSQHAGSYYVKGLCLDQENTLKHKVISRGEMLGHFPG